MVEELRTSGASASARTQRDAVRIKVVGVGDGGCNSIKQMLRCPTLPGAAFAMVNPTRTPEISDSRVRQVQLTDKAIRLMESGADLRSGTRAVPEAADELDQVFRDAQLVFIAAGLGGGTGTGAAPGLAHLARERGALVMGVVTTPFTFEGLRRREQALKGVDRLRPCVDSLMVIHSDRLLDFVDYNASMADAFHAANGAVARGITCVARLVNRDGEADQRLADVKRVLKGPGDALLAIGSGTGGMGAMEAARQAIANPLLDRRIGAARGVLCCFQGGRHLTSGGVDAAVALIAGSVDRDACVVSGAFTSERLGDEVRLTLVATSLERDVTRRRPDSPGPGNERNRAVPNGAGGFWGRGKKQPATPPGKV